MKNPILSLFILMMSLITVAQNTWTVNPDPNSAADFHTLRDAIDGATAGDVLLLHPGTYAADTLDKQLTITGTGYFLNENPETQANPLSSTISGSFRILAGADNSIISGIEFLDYTFLNGVSNVLIERCTGSIIYIDNTSFFTLSQSYLTSLVGNLLGTTNNNVTIQNSVLSATNSFTSCTISNCVITDSTPNSRNTTFKNNIFLSSSTSTVNAISFNNTFFNNIFIGIGDSSGLNGTNQINVALSSLFVDASTTSTDGQYQLASGSPAIGAGEGGTDCGIFGGTDPYVLSGIPRIPHIYEVSIPSSATTADGLQIQIKAKVSN